MWKNVGGLRTVVPETQEDQVFSGMSGALCYCIWTGKVGTGQFTWISGNVVPHQEGVNPENQSEPHAVAPGLFDCRKIDIRQIFVIRPIILDATMHCGPKYYIPWNAFYSPSDTCRTSWDGMQRTAFELRFVHATFSHPIRSGITCI